jgi:hypothetical protein
MLKNVFFCVAQEEKTQSPAVRAYTSIDGVRNRIAMVRSAAEAWFPIDKHSCRPLLIASLASEKLPLAESSRTVLNGQATGESDGCMLRGNSTRFSGVC